jgi:hypothetical protein
VLELVKLAGLRVRRRDEPQQLKSA